MEVTQDTIPYRHDDDTSGASILSHQKLYCLLIKIIGSERPCMGCIKRGLVEACIDEVHPKTEKSPGNVPNLTLDSASIDNQLEGPSLASAYGEAGSSIGKRIPLEPLSNPAPGGSEYRAAKVKSSPDTDPRGKCSYRRRNLPASSPSWLLWASHLVPLGLKIRPISSISFGPDYKWTCSLSVYLRELRYPPHMKKSQTESPSSAFD